MKKTIVIILCFWVLYVNLNAQTNPKPFVIPSLQEWEGEIGTFPIVSSYYIYADKKDENAVRAAKILMSDLQDLGIKAKIVTKKYNQNTILLNSLFKEETSLKKEGYYLKLDQPIIALSAKDYKGLIWGTRTLLQLIEMAQKENVGLPKGTIKDFPAYASRGFVLDDGRKFFSLEFLKRYVKMLSYYKMSEFQIHLNDNGFKKYFGNNWDSTYSGFAIESSTYPQLNKNGEFYTKKEFIALQKMAQDYGVDIIPEIDVPAHSLAISKAIPAIASKKYGRDHLDLSNPETITVVDNIFKEYIGGTNPVFMGPYVHIGTDEYAKEESEHFRAFTDHLIHLVQGYGKKVRAWGALTHAAGKTPVTSKDVTLNIWYNGYADPLEMKNLGYKLISTPDGFLYIVPAAGYYYDYLNLPFLYQTWTPLKIGDVHFSEGDSSLVGGSFAVWNDIVGNGITAMDVQNRVFPALQVLSEKMWSTNTDTLNYTDFSKNAKVFSEYPKSSMLSFPIPIWKDSLNLPSNIWGNKKTVIDMKYPEIMTNVEHIGLNYNVSFDIIAGDISYATPLFSDTVWKTFVYLLPNREIAFRRENYNDTFHFALPRNQTIKLEIAGNNKGVTLSADGHKVSTLNGIKISKSVKDTMFYVQTLSFPLQKIGNKQKPFNGKISNLDITVFRRLVEQ